MEAKLVTVLALALVLLLPAGVQCNSYRRTITLDVNGTEDYRDSPFYAQIGEALDIDCQHTQKLSLFSVSEDDYNNCTLPVTIGDGGTSVSIGDCPRVITLVLATNIVTNLVNYEVGGTYYYAAYGVNDSTYLDHNTDLCMAGVKFKIHIKDENEEMETTPSSTVVPTTSQTTVTTGTSSVTVTATPTSGVSTQPTTLTTVPTTSTTTERTTDTERATVSPVTRPSIDDADAVIAEGVADSAFSHRPCSSLLTVTVLLAVTLAHISRWL